MGKEPIWILNLIKWLVSFYHFYSLHFITQISNVQIFPSLNTIIIYKARVKTLTEPKQQTELSCVSVGTWVSLAALSLLPLWHTIGSAQWSVSAE